MIRITEIVKIKHSKEFPTNTNKQQFIDFLYHHLGQYGDKKADIERAIDYAFSSDKGKGGFLLIGYQKDAIVGGAVVIDTGMSGYIPEHILVYITTHEKHRGKGIGTEILEKIFHECSGNIALHVEYDNPAVRLYEHVGFTSKYAEMRYQQKDA